MLKVRIRDDLTEFYGAWLVCPETIGTRIRLILINQTTKQYHASYPIDGLDVFVTGKWLPFREAWSRNLISFYAKSMEKPHVVDSKHEDVKHSE